MLASVEEVVVVVGLVSWTNEGCDWRALSGVCRHSGSSPYPELINWMEATEAIDPVGLLPLMITYPWYLHIFHSVCFSHPITTIAYYTLFDV